MSKIPASVGRSKRKTFVESENYLQNFNLGGKPFDQFRKEFDFLWKDETIVKGAYGSSYSSTQVVTKESFLMHNFQEMLPMQHRSAASDEKYKGAAPLWLLLGPVMSEVATGNVRRIYAVVHPHLNNMEGWPPAPRSEYHRFIRYGIPQGIRGAVLSGMLYGTNKVYHIEDVTGQPLGGFAGIDADDFIYNELGGIDPGNPIFDTGPTYRDNLITMDAPYNVRGGEALDSNDMVFFDLKSQFNYNQEEYVGVITKQNEEVSSFDERLLPNFYQILSDYVQDKRKFEASNLFSGMVSKELTSFYAKKSSSDIKKPYMLKYREYFSTYASVLSELANTGVVTSQVAGQPKAVQQEDLIREASKSTNIIITSRNWDYLSEHGRHIKEFPLYVEIAFRSEVNSGISKLFSEVFLDEPLLKTFAAAFEEHTVLSTDSESSPRELIPASTDVLHAGKYFSTRRYAIGSVGDTNQVNHIELNEFDFMSWLEDYRKDGGSIWADSRMYQPNSSLIGEEEATAPMRTHKGGQTKRDKFLAVLLSLLGVAKVEEFKKKYRRSFENILQGVPCHSETIAYKICKHIVSENGTVIGKPIQRFWISNNPNTEIIKFYDTQVKFDARYKYIAYAYKMVIGSEYKYVDLDSGGDPARFLSGVTKSPNVASWDCTHPEFPAEKINHTVATVQIDVSPTVKILEVPYYGFDADDASVVRVYDDPPLPPNIEVIPYVGINNLFLLNLNSAIGRHEDYVRTIEPTDGALFEKVREYQERSPEDKVIFRNDDYPAYFEIFRIEPNEITGITTPPRSYADFSGRLIQTIDGPYVSVKQKVLPNKKYYYTFRSIDSRGNISNPGPVYEIELVGNDLTFPIIKQHVFPDKFKGAPLREGRRFLYVKPNYDQIEVDTEKSGLKETAQGTRPVLGIVPEEPLFSSGDNNPKRFKIRLTSKKSGKKIDFNVRFKHEHENFK